MDSITPEVDGFCCTVAKKVNSLLFWNSWINFSLTWGAAWISLSMSRNQEEKQEETGEKKERRRGRRRSREEYRRKRRGEMRRKRKKDPWLKMSCPKNPDCNFHFPLLTIVFIFRHHSPLPTAAFIQCKSRKCYLCHHAHLSLWQVHNWPDSDFLAGILTGHWAIQFAANRLGCCK